MNLTFEAYSQTKSLILGRCRFNGFEGKGGNRYSPPSTEHRRVLRTRSRYKKLGKPDSQPLLMILNDSGDWCALVDYPKWDVWICWPPLCEKEPRRDACLSVNELTDSLLMEREAHVSLTHSFPIPYRHAQLEKQCFSTYLHVWNDLKHQNTRITNQRGTTSNFISVLSKP